jgi:uncharacterized protein YqgQ
MSNLYDVYFNRREFQYTILMDKSEFVIELLLKTLPYSISLKLYDRRKRYVTWYG